MRIVGKTKTKSAATPFADEAGPYNVGGHYSKRVRTAVRRLEIELDLNMRELVLKLILEALAKYKIPLAD